MDLTASVLRNMLTKESRSQPHTFFAHPDSVAWLDQLERLIQVQYLHKFDRDTGTGLAKVRRGKTFWQNVNSSSQIKPGAAIYLPPVLRPPSKATAAPFLVLAVRHTPFRVSMTAMLHPTSDTLVIALTGLRSRSVGVGAAVTCDTSLISFNDVCRTHMGIPAPAALTKARVHKGISSLLHHFTDSASWPAVVQAAQHPRVKHIVFAGFSLGGSITHLLSQLLRAKLLQTPKPPPMLVVVIGAPRTGDAVWAHAFTHRDASFAHINLVSAARQSPTSSMIDVDEVTTMPLHASGFQSCLPLVAVVDGDAIRGETKWEKKGDSAATKEPLAFSADALSTKNLWDMSNRWSMCMGSVNFLKGFSHMHRLTLQPH